jgi:glycosyltransferase involved in cell wall biosynthesis
MFAYTLDFLYTERGAERAAAAPQPIHFLEVLELSDTLYIVVPCYNEEEVLHITAERLAEKITALTAAGKISEDSRIAFVDDGSRDGTWGIIERLCAESKLFAGVKLSRNRGHQNALLAGLMTVREEADMVISIDADLQDDIGAVDKMVDEYINGCDIVYGVRGNRESDSFFKRATAQRYYKLLRSLGCDVMFNHADYRLMSSRALAALAEYGEQRLFLRGLVPMLGYKTAVVEYTRGVREAGESKYPLKRMLTLAIDGVTSLSLRPLRAVTVTGVLMLIVAAVLFVYSIITLIIGRTILDWKLITFSIWAVGGVITLSLGIVGEYVGRTYIETKRRPRYFVEKTTNL